MIYIRSTDNSAGEVSDTSDRSNNNDDEDDIPDAKLCKFYANFGF